MGFRGFGETRRRVLTALVVVAVGVAVGVGVGGVPTRSQDEPLHLTRATTTTTAAPPPVQAAAVPVSVAGPRPPAAVNVIALNASGVGGIAGRVGTRLREAGYNVSPPAVNPRRQPKAGVLFRPGFEDDAAAVAALLGLGRDVVVPAPATPPADVVVMVGEDLARRS